MDRAHLMKGIPTIKLNMMERMLPSAFSVRQSELMWSFSTLNTAPEGSGIYLFGNATSPYTVILDDQTVLEGDVNPNTTVLYSNGKLGGDDSHVISVSVGINDTSQIFGLDSAIVESSLTNG